MSVPRVPEDILNILRLKYFFEVAIYSLDLISYDIK